MASNTVTDSMTLQGSEDRHLAISDLADLHDKTWLSLSKAKSVASALVADDHVTILNDNDVSNLLSLIEDLVDSAMIGVEKNWELISLYRDAEKVVNHV